MGENINFYIWRNQRQIHFTFNKLNEYEDIKIEKMNKLLELLRHKIYDMLMEIYIYICKLEFSHDIAC